MMEGVHLQQSWPLIWIRHGRASAQVDPLRVVGVRVDAQIRRMAASARATTGGWRIELVWRSKIP
jgi:hypothetical protein